MGNADRWREIRKADGNSFTDDEARRLQVGSSIYISVNYALPSSKNPPSNPPSNSPKKSSPEPGSNVSVQSNLNFSLQNQSLWGLSNVLSTPRLNVYGKPGFDSPSLFGLGKASLGFEYKLEAFLSTGTFDVDFPTLFDIRYTDKIQAGDTIASISNLSSALRVIYVLN